MLSVGFVALGANLPAGETPPRVTLERAMDLLFQTNVVAIARSRLYQTPAFPDPSAPPYVNACVSLQTDLSAKALLQRLHRIEDDLGRVREQRWGARIIDLDLVSFGAAVVPDRATHDAWAGLPPQVQMTRTPDELILPHPRIADRAFVLVPMAEIAPLWRHPVSGLSVKEMLQRLPKAETDAIRPLGLADSPCQAH